MMQVECPKKFRMSENTRILPFFFIFYNFIYSNSKLYSK